MLTSIHFLVTYGCNFACDHCFLYGSPRAKGTFTIGQIQSVLEEAKRIGTIESVFFEGGEPFLYYPLVVEAIERAGKLGFRSGIVTNAYWATSPEDAELWLRPLFQRGVTSISISDDPLHYGDGSGSHAQNVMQAAEKLGMTAKVLCTQRPEVLANEPDANKPGEPLVGGGVRFRGRAVEKLAAGLPTRPWHGLTKCPHEKLDDPSRVHVDCFGHVHLCQGISMGNFWQTPLSEIVKQYRPTEHPIVGPLLQGGPAELVRRYDLSHEEGYIEECHLCFAARLALLERFDDCLAPPQVYGL